MIKKSLTRIVVLVMIAILLMTTTSFGASISTDKTVKKIKITNIKNGKKIKAGKKVKIKTKVAPKKLKKSLTYTSSAPDIASVSKKGIIKARSNGKAIITIRYKKNKKIKAKVKIQVTGPKKKISLSGDGTVHIGSKSKITAKVTPKTTLYKPLKWKSSNKSVAKVNKSGVVTAIKPGTITITVTDKYGRKKKKKITVYKINKNSTKFIAHRGLMTEAPENTAKAFELAGQAGFWGAECDVHESAHDESIENTDVNESDDMNEYEFELVLNHNTTLEAVSDDTRAIKKLTANQLKDIKITKGSNAAKYNQGICTFDEYLDICVKYGMVPVIEIKDTKMSGEALKRIVDDTKERGLLSKAYFISFVANELKYVSDYAKEEYGADIVTQYLLGNSIIQDVLSADNFAISNEFTGVAHNYNNLNDTVNADIMEKNLSLNMWTYSKSSIDQMYDDINKYKPNNVTTNGVLWD